MRSGINCGDISKFEFLISVIQIVHYWYIINSIRIAHISI